MPGDIVGNVKVSEKTSKAILGPGLKEDGDDVAVTKPGILRHKEPNIYWIDSHHKRVGRPDIFGRIGLNHFKP